MKLEIILRTHDKINIHDINDRNHEYNGNKGRNIDASKSEIVVRCANSLFKSIDHFKNANPGHKIDITILDDHSTPKTVKKLKKFNRVTTLKGSGYNDSMVEGYGQHRDSDADLVYSVEDDILHEINAIEEMVKSYNLFVNNVVPDSVCVYPVDDILNYDLHVKPTLIVPGHSQAWRLHEYGSGTFMTPPKVIKNHWIHFERISTFYSPEKIDQGGWDDENTWNIVWKNHIPMFIPIGPLAFHLHYVRQGFYQQRLEELWEENKL